MSEKLLLLANAGLTFYLVGLIWTIQVVHYPLFAEVGSESYVQYQAGHQWRITTIVLVPMILELGTAGLLMLIMRKPLAVVAFALVLVVWASTFFLQVPAHTILDRGFDATAHNQLVSTNWVRTVAWSLRGVISLWWIWEIIK